MVPKNPKNPKMSGKNDLSENLEIGTFMYHGKKSNISKNKKQL